MISDNSGQREVFWQRINVLLSALAVLVIALVAMANELEAWYLWAQAQSDELLLAKLNGVVVPLAAFVALACGILAHLIGKDNIRGEAKLKTWRQLNFFDNLLMLAIAMSYLNIWMLKFEGFKELVYLPERIMGVLLVVLASRLALLTVNSILGNKTS